MNFLAWLSRLAENNLIDAVRALESAKRPDPKKRVTGAANAEESAIQFIDMLSASGSTPSRVMGRGEAAGLLDLALRRLPPDYEKVVRLYDLAGKPRGDGGQELGRSEGGGLHAPGPGPRPASGADGLGFQVLFDRRVSGGCGCRWRGWRPVRGGCAFVRPRAEAVGLDWAGWWGGGRHGANVGGRECRKASHPGLVSRRFRLLRIGS